MIDADVGDVLIVAGSGWAYHCFWEYSAYIFQSGRNFRRPVTHLGYYANGAIQREFPRIRARRDHVHLTSETISALRATNGFEDAAVADLVERMIADGRENSFSQLFLLSCPECSDTLQIDKPILGTKHGHLGRHVAWTQGHRYVPWSSLSARFETTDELDAHVKG